MMSSMVAIGVDTHRDTHVAVALDRVGGSLGSLEVTADANGYLALWVWA
jgi:transposase